MSPVAAALRQSAHGSSAKSDSLSASPASILSASAATASAFASGDPAEGRVLAQARRKQRVPFGVVLLVELEVSHVLVLDTGASGKHCDESGD